VEVYQEHLNPHSFSSVSEKRWNIKGLLFCHLLIIILAGSFFWPTTKHVWEMIDISLFKWLNNSLKGREHWQLFWAMSNHRLADWVEDIVIFTFYVLHIKRTVKEKRSKRISELVFCVFYIAFIIIFINRVLFRYIIVFYRDSPTLALDDTLRLSEEIPWMSIKDDSSKCFPGDHATTALLFAASYSLLAPRKLSIFAWGYTIFLCLPRMFAGAHWFSDVMVGSGSITLFFLSWAFCTPFMFYAAKGFEKCYFQLKLFKQKWSSL